MANCNKFPEGSVCFPHCGLTGQFRKNLRQHAAWLEHWDHGICHAPRGDCNEHKSCRKCGFDQQKTDGFIWIDLAWSCLIWFIPINYDSLIMFNLSTIGWWLTTMHMNSNHRGLCIVIWPARIAANRSETVRLSISSGVKRPNRSMSQPYSSSIYVISHL